MIVKILRTDESFFLGVAQTGADMRGYEYSWVMYPEYLDAESELPNVVLEEPEIHLGTIKGQVFTHAVVGWLIPRPSDEVLFKLKEEYIQLCKAYPNIKLPVDFDKTIMERTW